MRIKSLLLSLAAFSSLALFAGAEEVSWTLDWSEGTVGKPATSAISPHVKLSNRSDDPEQFLIVGAAGSPLNPFTHLEKALLVQRTGEAKVPIVIFSLPGKGGYGKGAFEFEFFLASGQSQNEGFRFNLRTIAPGEKAASAGVFRFNPRGISFHPGEGAEILRSKISPMVGAVNTLKIEWDLASSKGFTVSLNDKPVVHGGGGAESTLFPLPEAGARGGVRDLLIYPRENMQLFLGKVSASAQ